MRASWLLAAALGCGRYGFEADALREQQSGDGPNLDGSTIDAFIDTSCAYQCTIDVVGNSNTCSGAITATLMGSRGTVVIDMTGRTSLELRAMICNPSGWVFHVCDSPTNDGGGGDGASSSNDAEAQFLDVQYSLYGNDYVPATKLLADKPVLAASGCSSVEMIVRDQHVELVQPTSLVVDSQYALRLNPPMDAEGTPDAIWYVGLNRTFGSVLRTGSGTQNVSLCQR